MRLCPYCEETLLTEGIHCCARSACLYKHFGALGMLSPADAFRLRVKMAATRKDDPDVEEDLWFALVGDDGLTIAAKIAAGSPPGKRSRRGEGDDCC